MPIAYSLSKSKFYYGNFDPHTGLKGPVNCTLTEKILNPLKCLLQTLIDEDEDSRL